MTLVAMHAVRLVAQYEAAASIVLPAHLLRTWLVPSQDARATGLPIVQLYAVL